MCLAIGEDYGGIVVGGMQPVGIFGFGLSPPLTVGLAPPNQGSIRGTRGRSQMPCGIHSGVEPDASQTSLVAILHAPKTVHTTSQIMITVTAIAVDSGTKYDESRSPAGPLTIP